MKKAYLIVDMNNDFVASDGALTVGAPAQKLVPSILRRAKAFLEEGNMVIFCNDCHEETDKHFAVWAPHCIQGTKGELPYGDLFSFYEENKENENVLIVPKSEYDGFYKTPLADVLAMNEVREVVISGVCTDICVFQTIYGAYKAGYFATVYKDETATFTEFGGAFLKNAAVAYKTTVL
jgi:nicotinamidase-related amidase